jgi:hypothetical protein
LDVDVVVVFLEEDEGGTEPLEDGERDTDKASGITFPSSS